MTCPNCGSAHPAEDRFCGNCGTPFLQRCIACDGENAPTSKFCRRCGTMLPGAHPKQRSNAAVERRQLTLLFCDLVGSTALAVSLDPEDLREIMGDYQRRCTEVAVRYGGLVTRLLGDGVLAYFGYPAADENDAERAVRAGLAMVDAVRQLRTPDGRSLQARVGIASGLVVIGEGGDSQEEAVVGDTPNLAARLQALAEPGAVIVSPSTRQLLGGRFDFADLGSHDLKGFGVPVRVWRVMRESEIRGRFEALHTGGLNAMVGRGPELALIMNR